MIAVVDFRQMVAVTDHRDAGLLDQIEQFTQLKDETWRLIHRAERFKADGRAYRRLWKEALSTRDERDRLERLICVTKAQTTLGVIAKAQLWLELHADNTGTMMDLPRAAITEMMAMLGEARA
jgi:hypothetical protein